MDSSLNITLDIICSTMQREAMPLIFREKGYEFSFVMFDLGEPMHVHVRQGRKQAKYWIEPIALAWIVVIANTS